MKNSGLAQIYKLLVTIFAGVLVASLSACNGSSSSSPSSTPSTPTTYTLNNVLSVSPLNPSVVPGGAVTFIIGGGTPPYTYTVLTTGGGSFSGNVFYSTATPGAVTVLFTDSANNASETTVTVGSTTTGTGSFPNCEGIFNMNLAGQVAATLVIVQNQSTGAITANSSFMSNGSTVASISGSCYYSGTTPMITFVDLYSGSPYNGTISGISPSLSMTGTFVDYTGTSYSWQAIEE